MQRLFGIAVVLSLALAAAIGPLSAQEEPELPEGLAGDEPTETFPDEPESLWDRMPEGLHGFLEARAGLRVVNDAVQSKAMTLAETRLQLAYDRSWRRLNFEFAGDLVADGIDEELDYDQRQFRLSLRLGKVDLRAGRQVLTWGTGDQLFINDLFPKDWRSLFLGRDIDYLKVPSDTLRLGWHLKRVNFDLAYTPRFAPDRFVRGERISFWDPAAGNFAGEHNEVVADVPDDWPEDDEIAARAYGTHRSYELALYAYRGFWKSPGGQDPVTLLATFPMLGVYGASVRGPVGPGILNGEVGYYDSREDRDGTDPFVNNSELRLLLGYEQELARETTGGFQYYVERILDYDAYRESLLAGQARDRTRHVVTVRITRRLLDQKLTLSMFGYVSPSDRDAYLIPRATYRVTDRWTVEGGANAFFGDRDFTFFGQFKNNSNVYLAARFSI